MTRGFDQIFSFQVEGHKVKKFSKFKDFREQFARERGIPPENQLWFGWAKRMNGTYRPKRLYDDYEDKQFVCSLRDEDNNVRLKAWTAKLNLFYMVNLLSIYFITSFQVIPIALRDEFGNFLSSFYIVLESNLMKTRRYKGDKIYAPKLLYLIDLHSDSSFVLDF